MLMQNYGVTKSIVVCYGIFWSGQLDGFCHVTQLEDSSDVCEKT